jgi:hypothetical protein
MSISIASPKNRSRRSFLKATAGTAALAGLGDLAFLSQLPRVSAAEARLQHSLVALHPEVEPLVRLLEETPRDRILEEVAARIKRGTTYREVLAALLLGGVRSIEPRPVGFKFHAVLVVNSAHLASLSSPDSDRWLPIFWAIDEFKSSQAANARESGWTMGAVEELAVPPAHKARQAFIDAMENWDEPAADTAMAGLARSASAPEIFELCCRYGVRDFQEIGHKQIYTANSFRTLEAIGWQHAEPVLRSLAFALLDRGGDRAYPKHADIPAIGPYSHSLETVEKIRADWLDGKPDAATATELLATIRAGSTTDMTAKVVELLNRGATPESLFDALHNGAGELLMHAPGILSLHATTFTNAVHYAFRHCRDEATRKLLLLQNASFMPLYRGGMRDKGVHIDTLEAAPLKAKGDGAIAEIFADVTSDRLSAARKVLSYLSANPNPKPLADAARRLIFLKGRDAHDYKFSSAVLEDYHLMSPPWRDRYLAASVFNLKGSGDPDNKLVQRTRAAIAG